MFIDRLFSYLDLPNHHTKTHIILRYFPIKFTYIAKLLDRLTKYGLYIKLVIYSNSQKY